MYTLKNIITKSLPCQYRSQQKVWFIFEEWVRDNENREIALIINNCVAHSTMGNLPNVRLTFLSLCTTSVSQPMDQGFSASVDLRYNPANISTLWINVEITLIRRWKWNKIRRRIFNVDTTLSQFCSNLASTLVKAVSKPAGLVISTDS